MTTYYLQVIEDNVSIIIDSDINYLHHFKIGDIIKVDMDLKKGPKVYFSHWTITEPYFILDWSETSSTRLSIAGCVKRGALLDISTQIERNDKLTKIGI